MALGIGRSSAMAGIMANRTDCAAIDQSFGPHAQKCRGGFDFTVLFEESILTLAPIGLIVLLSPSASFISSTERKRLLRMPSVCLSW